MASRGQLTQRSAHREGQEECEISWACSPPPVQALYWMRCWELQAVRWQAKRSDILCQSLLIWQVVCTNYRLWEVLSTALQSAYVAHSVRTGHFAIAWSCKRKYKRQTVHHYQPWHQRAFWGTRRQFFLADLSCTEIDLIMTAGLKQKGGVQHYLSHVYSKTRHQMQFCPTQE